MFQGNWVTPYIIAKMERVSCYVIALIVLIVLFFFIVTFVVVYISELNFPSLTIHNTTAMNPWLLVIRINHKVKKPFKFKILQPFGFLYFLFVFPGWVTWNRLFYLASDPVVTTLKIHRLWTLDYFSSACICYFFLRRTQFNVFVIM